MITSSAKCTWDIKSRTDMAKAALSKNEVILNSETDLNLRKKLVQGC
jgi:ribosome-associated protein YbcJ (S4-like RNA binding protein)